MKTFRFVNFWILQANLNFVSPREFPGTGMDFENSREFPNPRFSFWSIYIDFVYFLSNSKISFFYRLRCIVWDLSRSFLLRLAISIFTVILIYTMAQVNTFTCSVDSCEAALDECEVRGTCHRICPLPHYIVLSCMLGFLAVAVFLRMPIMIKSLLLCAMALVYVLLIGKVRTNRSVT